MKNPLLIQSLIIIGLFLSSCNLFSSGNQQETNNNTSDSASTQEKETSSAKSETKPETTQTAESLDPIQSEVSSVAGLKRATDPEQFVQQRGVTPGTNRSDPFTLFPVPPQEKPQPLNESSESEPSESDPSQAPSSSQPAKPAAPAKPTPLPEPKLARAVAVQGAIQIGNEAVVILRGPNETTSRYVRPGQSIANGQVLVKRINMQQRPTPTVVLKEMGVDQEVVKAVEEEKAAGATTVRNESTAQLPPPPSQFN